MNKVEKAIEHIKLTRPTYEDFEEFHKEKPDISQDDFIEAVAYMHGKVLAKHLELTPSEKHEVMNRLMEMIIDEIACQ